MLPFSARNGTTFSYRADFSDIPYANISFYDREGREILFHLSLRGAEGLAVCNRRGDAGWEREIARRVALPPAGVHVEIRFAPTRLQVRLDGRRVFSFGGPLRRQPFDGLARIGLVDFQGGIDAAEIEIDQPAEKSRGPELVLTGRLEIVARGLNADATVQKEFQLEIAGIGDSPPLIERVYPYTLRRGGRTPFELCAVLPGRIWREAGDPDVLAMRLRRGGAVLAGLDLSRVDLARHIEALLAAAGTHRDPRAEMLALEHVRFAQLGPRLGPQARAALATLAGFYQLEDFLYAGAARATIPAPPAPDPDDAAVVAAHRHFGQTMRAAPEKDPAAVLEDILAAHSLSNAARRRLLLAVTEVFCARDRFGALFDLAGQGDHAAFAPDGDAWHDSALLPWLMMQGRVDALPDLLRALGETQGGWIVTPALAWVMRRAFEDARIPQTSRAALLHAFTGFLETRASDYWARSSCTALIDTAVFLLAQTARRDDPARGHVADVTLRAYGLSRRFWACVDTEAAAGRLHLPAALRAGRAAFAMIAEHIEAGGGAGGAAIAGALDVFERAGNPEVVRFRRELLGPARIALPDGTAPEPAELLRAGPDPGEAALRYLAFPGAAPGGAALAETAAQALPAHYPHVPHAPRYRLQCAVGRQAAALAAGAADGRPPAADEIDALAGDLDQLSGASSRFLGLGAGLALLDGLARAGAEEAGARLLDHLARLRAARPAGGSAALRTAPALRGPLQALARTGGPLAHKALTLFEDAAPPAASATATAHPDWARASPVFDTIVTVFSCKPNLGDRIPAMRDGWLGLLADLGVPYVVVVGDGDGRQDGDILRLDAPDDYEGLPEKTLAAIRWVHDHTPFAHMLKIDDDCFLEPLEFFHSLSWRKFDYYGRVLTRTPGQMNRAWHCAKATSPRGRFELDKSPEPSSYADGGSGYALSRAAMAAALKAAESPAGRQLRQISFMEDKLLGDLLALEGLEVADEDYRIAIRRRSHARARPVPMWENGFYASRAAPVKLVHLDTHLDQGVALTARNRTDLTPKKIWPSYASVRLGHLTNTLELVSDAAKLERAREAPVTVVAAMRNEMFMLPHFLAHYRRLGVEAFLIADNLSDDGTLEYLADQPDIGLFSVETDYRHSHFGVAWQQALMANFRVNRWSLVADADELLVWQEEPRETLPDLLAGPAFENADAARVFMLDMYPKGPLEAADFASGDPFKEAGYVDRTPLRTDWPGRGPFSNAPTWTSALRHRLIPDSRADLFVAQKIALMRYRPWMRLSAGLHFVADAKLAARELIFAHFKYNADFRRKVRTEVTRRQHFNDAEEYRKYLALISEGREVIFDPAVSVPWREAAFVRRILAGGRADPRAKECSGKGREG